MTKTLPTIRTEIEYAIESEYGTPVNQTGKTFLRAFTAVMSVLLWTLSKRLDFVKKNIFVDTADEERLGGTLERWGRVMLGRGRNPATAGQYTIAVTGSSGSIIGAGTTLKSNDDATNPQKLFIIDQQFTLSGTSGSVNIRSLQVGADSKLVIADNLSFTIPISGVDETAKISAVIQEPQEIEDIEDYRILVERKFREEPQGGAAIDYRMWSNEVAGVSQSYPYTASGKPAEINLFIEAISSSSSDGFGTPGATLLSNVEGAVELDPDVSKPISERGRRNLGVFKVNYLPVTVKQVVISIPEITPLEPSQQSQITQALTELCENIRPFIPAIDDASIRNDVIDTNRIVNTILSTISGISFGTVVIQLDGVETVYNEFLNGDIPNLSQVNFI